jgi:hypothetical protein
MTTERIQKRYVALFNLGQVCRLSFVFADRRKTFSASSLDLFLKKDNRGFSI